MRVSEIVIKVKVSCAYMRSPEDAANELRKVVFDALLDKLGAYTEKNASDVKVYKVEGRKPEFKHITQSDDLN